MGMRFHKSKAVAPIRDRLFRTICERLALIPGQITPTTSFIEDVGADSLDVVKLVMAVEEEFGVSIPEDEAEKIKTVGDVIDFLARRQL
jgi:acyl carrier protein